MGRLFRLTRASLVAGLALALASCAPAPAGEPSAEPTQAAVAKFLALQVDTVRGPEGLSQDERAFLSCVQQNRFPQGSQIVWRVRVTDPVSGSALDDTALKSLTLTLPDGKTQTLKYGPHPAQQPLDFFWTTSFKVPADYPTGQFSYKLEAVDAEGRTAMHEQFKVAAAMLQIIPAGRR